MIIFNRDSKNIISKWWWQTDKVILGLITVLLLAGILLVITASPFVAVRIGAHPFYFISWHLVYVTSAILIIFFISNLRKEYIVKMAIVGFIVSIILLIIVLFGEPIKGSKRWIKFLGFTLQPSEFAKIFFPIFIIMVRMILMKLNISVAIMYLSVISIYIIVVTLLLLQPDLGTAILITVIFFTIMYVMGMNYITLFLVVCFGIFISVGSYFFFSHVNYRVNSFISSQTSYQVSKALETFPNGKLFGVGAGQGIAKRYLPDSHTDFIFSVGAEEFGLVFSLALIGFYIILILRILQFIQKQQNIEKSLILLSSVIIIACQSLIHIASNANMIPTKGMTLPLISYGGSSLLSMSILMGIILNLTKKDPPNSILRDKV